MESHGKIGVMHGIIGHIIKTQIMPYFWHLYSQKVPSRTIAFNAHKVLSVALI